MAHRDGRRPHRPPIVCKEQLMTEATTAWLDLAGLPFSVSWVDAAGVPTRSLQSGDPDGPVVVFLHGTSGHLEAFTRNVRAHVEAGYRVHAIDMLGHGYTAKPD